MRFVLPFSDPSSSAIPIAGGKGASLAAMTRRGLPVPPGVVVSTDAYRAFAAQAGGGGLALESLDGMSADDLARIRREARRVRERLAALPLPVGVDAELRRWVADSAGASTAFAVRSSGTAEDLAGAAFAGQHDTFLNCVGADEVVARVKDCWLSLWEERAVAYRARVGARHADVAMAVVVQAMVACDVSGVAFTIDPVSGALDRMVVDANFGLGESVVSGEGEVDHFVLEKASGGVIEARLARKTTRVVAARAGRRGTEVTRVDDADAGRRTLADADLARLADLLRRVESAAGGWPQDVEWGMQGGTLWLLQSRPVTAVPPRWTRDESAERFPNVVTPFTWDFVDEGFHRSLNHSFALMGLPPFGGRWFALFDHYVYGDQNAVELYARRAPASPTTLAELQAMLPALLERFAWVTRLPDEWHAALPAYLSEIDRLLAEPLEGRTARELWDYVERVNRVGTRYFLPNIAISLGHGLLHRSLHALIALVRGPADADALTAALAACETKTTEVNAELRSLAAFARRNTALAPRLRSAEPSRALLEELRTLDAPFAAALRRFVAEHGHRETDFDAYHPTWADAPWVVLDHVRSLLDVPEVPNEGRAVAEREAAERELLAALPAEMRGFAAELIRLARVYTALDDLEHYHTTRLTPPLRRGVRALGAPLAAGGVIAEPMDLFFARKSELAAAVAAAEPAAWRALGASIARRKAAYLADRNRTPEWVLGEGAAPARDRAPAAAATMRGIAGSPGVAEGEVFVVRSADDFSRFPRGAVLVARTTSPAWTPLFYRAGAVVTESGGPLSHGAVTAREMRIPAVMAVRGVLGALADGTRVRVDGGAGVVELV